MLTERRARVALRIALAALLLAVFAHTRADPDLWGHIRFGGDTIAARSAHVPDRYSFTTDRPWINHEWLAECVMYAAYAIGGSAALILLKVALLAAMIAAVAWSCRATASTMTMDLVIGLVAFATVPQANHVRPQLFSLVLFAWEMAILGDGRGRLPWILVPLMAIWANLHGGWMVGAGVLLLWATLSDRGNRRWNVGLALTAAAATLANPYGWNLWAFLHETVGFGRADISEWQPITSAGLAVAMIWAVAALAAALAARRMFASPASDYRSLAIVAMLGTASFRVNRLLAFFAIATAILMKREIAAVAVDLLARVGRSKDRPLHMSPTIPNRPAFAIVVAAILAAGSITAFARNATCVRMDLPFFPDAEVGAAARAASLHGRMLVWFDWGEYAIWHLAPAVSVSIDGRRETVYSDDVLQRHLRFYFRPSERQETLDALHPDYIWLPRELDVTRDLRADGWMLVAQGPQSALLARAGAPRTPPLNVHVGARCFPGP